MVSIEMWVPEYLVWILLGLGGVSVIISGLELYYRRKLWKIESR